MTGFRAWDKEKKWDKGEKKCYDTESNLFINPRGRVMLYDRTAKPLRWKDVTDRYDIEWETGREDSKGREIYQGDRLRWPILPNKYREADVVWGKQPAGWGLTNKDTIFMPLEHRTGGNTIIGTIHDEKGSE